MSALITSPGILLRSYPYSESSKVLRFLTPGHGLLSVIGKGVRSRRYRAEAPLETFGEGVLTFSLRPHRDLHTLQDFRQGEGAMALGRDPQRFVGASLWAELLLGHALEGGDEELYGWVSSALRELGRMEGNEVPSWVLTGGWRILSLLGFPPELESCVRCGNEIAATVGEGALAYFSVTEGGVVCPECVGAGRLPRVGPLALDQLRALGRGDSVRIEEGVRSHLGLLESFASYHIGGARGQGEIRSFAIIRSLWAGKDTDFP
jgi:DNA repair protein RecO (recombination protein O)